MVYSCTNAYLKDILTKIAEGSRRRVDAMADGLSRALSR
jgi:hypothetical protein